MLISLNWCQTKRKTGIASMQKGRKDPCRALGRKGPAVGSSTDSCEDCRPLASFEHVPGCQGGAGHSTSAVDAGLAEAVRDMARERFRRGLGRRPYRLGRRTPVLYSRNQPRTNIVPRKEKTEGGGTACRVAQYESGKPVMDNTRQLQECLPYHPSHCFLVLWVPSRTQYQYFPLGRGSGVHAEVVI